MTLVVDDLHVLTDPRVLDGLDYVLRNAGPGLRLVASSRMDPLLPLHRYQLAGELAEIRASDLAFSTAEASLLLARHGITLSADSLECTGGRRAGRPPSASPRSPRTPIPTPTNSSRSWLRRTAP